MSVVGQLRRTQREHMLPAFPSNADIHNKARADLFEMQDEITARALAINPGEYSRLSLAVTACIRPRWGSHVLRRGYQDSDFAHPCVQHYSDCGYFPARQPGIAPPGRAVVV